MKILITENQFKLLKELGDSDSYFPYENISNLKFKFFVKNYPLIVQLQKVLLNDIVGYSLRFGSELNNNIDPKHKVLNLGQPLKTIGTIAKILFSFIKKNNPDLVFFHATRKFDAEDVSKNQRYKLYNLFFNKIINLFPEYNLSKIDRVFIISKKEISIEDISMDILKKNYEIIG